MQRELSTKLTEGLSYLLFSVSTCSTAERTAAIIKAVNVQLVPLITLSTSSTTSTGKRIVLLVVGGITGILKKDMYFTSYLKCEYIIHYYKIKNCKIIQSNIK